MSSSNNNHEELRLLGPGQRNNASIVQQSKEGTLTHLEMLGIAYPFVSHEPPAYSFYTANPSARGLSSGDMCKHFATDNLRSGWGRRYWNLHKR